MLLKINIIWIVTSGYNEDEVDAVIQAVCMKLVFITVCNQRRQLLSLHHACIHNIVKDTNSAISKNL